MTTPTFDPRRALAVLANNGVRFVLIGGLAANARGSPSVTIDLDICYARDARNLARLTTALRELKATLRGSPPAVPFVLDVRTMKLGDHFRFETSAGNLDCSGTPAGTEGFRDLASRASRLTIAEHKIAVASLDDLIAMKRAAGRPKDLLEVEILVAVKEESERDS